MRLFVFGLGYSAERLSRRLIATGWQVAGTTRSPERAEALRAAGIVPVVASGNMPEAAIGPALDRADHLLISIPPGPDGDPVLARYREQIAAQANTLKWIGYLSTVGVYGDRGGGWVDEETPPEPATARAERRVQAEAAWRRLGADLAVPVAIFRIAGIYGPGRNALCALKAGTAKCIVKPGQLFNRIHVDDIAAALDAAIALGKTGIYNLADGNPAPPQDVVAFAAALLGVKPPPEIPFATASATMTPMARSFYADNKWVSNRRMIEELGVSLAYPDYRAGLTALHRAGEGQ